MAKDKYGLKVPGAKASPARKKQYLESVERRKGKAVEVARLDAKIKAAAKR